LGLNLPRLGDQPQYVFPFPLRFLRRFGQEVGWPDVGGVLATFSLDAVVVANAVSDDVELERRRRLPGSGKLCGVAARPKVAWFGHSSNSIPPEDTKPDHRGIFFASTKVRTWLVSFGGKQTKNGQMDHPMVNASRQP
jgi:hypothetical protein